MSSSQTNERSPGARSLGEIVDSFGLTRAHYIALTLVVLGGMFEVFEQVDVSSVGPSLEKAFGINASQISLLSTITLLAIVVGGIASGLIADRFGRRSLLSVNLIIYCLGTVLSAVAPTYGILELTRIVTGIGVGGEIAVGLTFLAELTPTKARGVFVSFFNTISAGIGGFLVYAYALAVLGPFSSLVGAGPDAWRWVFGLLGIPAVLIVFFRRYLPESPRHLLQRGDIEGANHSLTRLATGRLRIRPGDVVGYVDSTTIAISESGKGESARQGLGSIVRRPLRRRTIALGITAYMAWGSQFSVIILMPLLLVGEGHSIAGSLTFTMIQNVGGLVGSCLASYGGFALPRRYVVSVGSIAAAISIVAFAIFAHGSVLILVLGFVFQGFLLLVNTTIWLWAPELFPTRVRGFGTSVVVNIGFLGGAIMPLAASALFNTGGAVAGLSLVAAMYLVMAISVWFVVESQGVSLEKLHGGRDKALQGSRSGAASSPGPVTGALRVTANAEGPRTRSGRERRREIRMTERDLQGYAGRPPQVWWPGRARVAVSLVVNYEEGSELAVGDGDATRERSRPSWPLTVRDLASESMYEYGSRAGFWRLMRVFDQAGVPATFFACAVALERNRLAARAIPKAGHEVMSHGYRWEDVTLLSREDERRHMEMALESLTETTGETPTGWYCRYGPSVHTRELVAANPHLRYDSDSYNDDLPFWADVSGAAHLVVPYTLAANDIKFDTGGFGSPKDFQDYLCANLDQLHAEGEQAPTMMSVGIHMRLAGLPGRAQALKNFIAYAQSLGDVWFARRDGIAAHWREHFPAQKGQAA